MKYLLDVNALLALGVLDHEFHQRMATWVDRLARRGPPELATCSITELGFVRVLGQAQQYRISILEARELLLQLKTSERIRCTFIVDGHDISHLPKWVKSPKQTTDGHLLELAKANKAQLATLDGRIPGVLFIPQGRRGLR
jgi:predicted nucleic acid-binding protein